MKKAAVISVFLCLILCACGRGGETEPVPTEAPTDIPEASADISPVDSLTSTYANDPSEDALTATGGGKTGIAALDGIGASCLTVGKGEQLTVTGEEGVYYTVKYNGGAYYIYKNDIKLSESGFPSKGAVKVKGAELYSFILEKDMTLSVLTEGGKLCLVSDGSSSGNIPRWAILFEEDKPYTVWSGISVNGAWLYGTWQMTDTPEKIKEGQYISVLLETDDGVYVKIGDKYGYMFVTDIERTDKDKATDTYPEWTEPKL